MDVAGDVVVERPRREVASFVFDTGNDALWHAGILTPRQPGDGPSFVGFRGERRYRFLGRQFDVVYFIVGLEPARSQEIRLESPFAVVLRYELEDEGEHTRVILRVAGDATGFLRLGDRLIASAVSRGIARDLQMLKAHLESERERRE